LDTNPHVDENHVPPILLLKIFMITISLLLFVKVYVLVGFNI